MYIRGSMISNLFRIALFTILLFSLQSAHGQVAKTQVIMVNAVANSSGVTLNWPSKSFTGNYLIFKRTDLNNMDWGSPISTLSSSETSYTDNTLLPGTAAEYRVVAANGSSAQAFGYIYVGNKLTEVLYKGGIMLLIDSTMETPLAAEIARLENDLRLEGWKVSSTLAGRNETPVDVKNRLKSEIIKTGFNVTTLLILGHIPVPYSGDFSKFNPQNIPPPDGHVEGSGDHTGAWPADGYYADLNGTWTDNSVVRTTGGQTRHHNIIGDGKFDQTKFPSELELEVGRVDLANMTTFTSSETELLRNYLNRNHAWRTQQMISVERALVDNNFGSLNLASTGYHNFSAFFPFDSISDLDYISTQAQESYLWSYGCGAGSYTSCSGVGSTTSFRDNDVKNIFTILAGSFFGDWDIANNFLRAPLCANSLASFWGGLPKWYVHTMGLGKHIGFGTRESQNNTNFYFNGAFNFSENSVHMALMGDPTLTNRHLPAVTSLAATSANKQVKLNWTKAQGSFDGYNVYRLDTAKKSFFRVNTSPIQDTFYTDAINWSSGKYIYTVRPIKLETTGSGSYYNAGGGVMTEVNHINSVQYSQVNNLKIYPNPTEEGVIAIQGNSIKQVRLFDLLGKQVKSQFVTNHLFFTEAPAGIYIAQIKFEDGTSHSVKIIKN